MGNEINLLELYPQSKRPIDQRGNLITLQHRKIARQFGRDFFDGERLYGYGGYYYHPRFWTATVNFFLSYYKLGENDSILDVGCGKGFMLHDFKQWMPRLRVVGLDISEYAIKNAIQTIKPFVHLGNAKELPFEDESFDLVISINTVHNLVLDDCKKALQEIERVSRKYAFITVDAWRTQQEKENLLKWNLTGLTYMHTNEWKKLFEEIGLSLIHI